MWDLKFEKDRHFERLGNDERNRFELNIFTRFVFEVVFRVSRRMVPWDIPATP